MTGSDRRTVGLADFDVVTGRCGDKLPFRGLAAGVSSGIGGGGRKRLVTDVTLELDLSELPELGRVGNGGGVGDTEDVVTTERTGDTDRCRGLGSMGTMSRLPADEPLSTETGNSFC